MISAETVMNGTPLISEEQMDNSEWMFDETEAAGTDFPAGSQEKADAEVQDIMESTELKAGQTVLVFGWGNGAFPLAAAEAGVQVILCDVSEQKLSAAVSAASERGLKIRTAKAGVIGFSDPDVIADAAVFLMGLHLLPDFWKAAALRNIRLHLKDKGKLYLSDMVFSVEMDKYEKKISGLLKYMKGQDEKLAEAYTMHIKKTFPSFDWILEEMLYRSGFEILDADYGDDLTASYICRKSEDMGL